MIQIGVLILVVALATTTSAQSVRAVYSFSASNASQYPEGTPAQGRDGDLYGTSVGQTFGSLFRFAATGQFNQTFALDGSDGSNPNSGVTLANDGDLYGTAPFGGSAGQGVLFKITRSGAYSVLHDFSGGTDGGTPQGPPIQASDGNLYGTTHGQPGASTVYKYNLKSASYSIINTFAGTQGLALAGPLLQGTDGKLYGTATQGGANGFGTIFKMTTAGTVLGFYSFEGGADGANPIGGLIQAADGNFYGVAGGGGAYSFGTVFRITPKLTVTPLYSFQGGTSDGEFPGSGLVQATDGNMYGATGAGGTDGFGVLYQISTGGVYKLLYSFQGLTGELPVTTLLQHTTGVFYGTAAEGGANGYGTVFILDMGLGPFVTFVHSTGSVGSPAQILGQGLTDATGVTFNGVPATTFSVVRDTYLTAIVPSGATTGPVGVTTPTGTLTSNKNFVVAGATAKKKKE